MAWSATVWNGTDEEFKRLKDAVANNCACDPTIPHVCSSHRMLTDQRTMDHLAFVAANVTDYIQAEFDPACEWFSRE